MTPKPPLLPPTLWNRIVQALWHALAWPPASVLRPTLHLVAYYPLLLTVPVMLFALLWGRLLSDYDAVHVLWHDDEVTGVLNGIGVALVFGEVMLTTYLLDRSRYIRALALYRDWPGGRHFQSRPPLPRPRQWGYWVTWLVMLLAAAAPALAMPEWFKLHNVAGDGDWQVADIVRTDANGNPIESEEVQYVQGRVGTFRSAMANARLWFPLGLLVTAMTVAGARHLCLRMFPAGDPVTSPLTAWGRRRRIFYLRMFRGPVYFAWVIVIALGVGYAALVLVHWALSGPNYCPTYPASVSVLLLVGFLTGMAWRFTALAGRRIWLYPLVIGVPLVLFLLRSCQTEYQLPNMTIGATKDTYYKQDTPQLETYRERHDQPGANFGLVDDAAALSAWDRHMRTVFGPEPQPVIVVAVSGGASASALYTANVLYTLEELFPGFADRVRIISGASGGMLGAAYFVTQLREGGVIYQNRRSEEYRLYYEAEQELGLLDPADPNYPAALTARNAAQTKFRLLALRRRADFFRGLEQDFLGPLVQKWVHKDMPLYFLPARTTNDRGQALEAAWDQRLKQNPVDKTGDGALAIPVKNLREDETAGRIPSLVFSPMMIEDGRQLLISNLDLAYMADTRVWSLGGGRVAPSETAPMSVTAMEFFRLFPNADQFRLGTAVRMNASFPYFSPSATLPTNPARHIVDAGYYDNYGTTVATKWIAKNAATLSEDRLNPKPAGARQPRQIVLLRIRCFAFEEEKREFVTQAERAALTDTPAGKIAHTDRGLFTLTAPLAGLFSAWRANMLYRGDERVAAVDALIASQRGRFQYPLAECGVDPSLNWALTPDTILRLHTDVWTRVRMPAQVANALYHPTTDAPAGLPTKVGDKAMKQSRAVGPGPLKSADTLDVIQAAPGIEKSSRPARQAIESVGDLATELVNLPLAAPGK